MNRRDDQITRLRESALHRVSRQGLSTPSRGIRGKKRYSKADFFAQLAEQFVDQVKSIARIDEPSEDEEDDDVILIDPKTSEPISKSGNGGLKVDERRVRIRGIPNRAASRVAEVLKNEFGITAFEAKRIDTAEDKEKSSLKEGDGQHVTRASDLRDKLEPSTIHASLPPLSAPGVAKAVSSDGIEIIEVDEKPNGTSFIRSPLREGDSKDRFGQTSDGNANVNASRVLATTSKDSAPANVACKSTSSSMVPSIDQILAENQPPSTCSTAVQCSPDRIAASQPVYRAQLFPTHQLTPVSPQPSSLRVVRELVKSTLPESARSSSLSAPPTPSSTVHQPETIKSESACCCSIRDTTDSDQESNDSASASVGDQANTVANLLAQPSIASQHSKPVFNYLGRGPNSWAPTSQKELSAEVVDSIHRNSQSITNFAVNLMRRLFDKSEIMDCNDLFKRARYFPAEESSDVKRIHLIHQLVQEKSGPEYSTELWDRCVQSMKAAIYHIRQMHKRDIRLGRIHSDDQAHGLLFPKESDDLKETEFYAQNGLPFQKINSLYHQSNSNLDFAKKIMLFLFDKSELFECYNINGRDRNNGVDQDRALDPKRIQIIKQILEENTDLSAQLWKECVRAMNRKISKLKRSMKS